MRNESYETAMEDLSGIQKSCVEIVENCIYPMDEWYAIEFAMESMEKLQEIEQIIKQHDEDSMPEDYFYIDNIREVLARW